MEQEGLAGLHGVLEVAEAGKPLLDEGVEGTLRLLRGDGVAEGPEVAEVVGEPDSLKLITFQGLKK